MQLFHCLQMSDLHAPVSREIQDLEPMSVDEVLEGLEITSDVMKDPAMMMAMPLSLAEVEIAKMTPGLTPVLIPIKGINQRRGRIVPQVKTGLDFLKTLLGPPTRIVQNKGVKENPVHLRRHLRQKKELDHELAVSSLVLKNLKNPPRSNLKAPKSQIPNLQVLIDLVKNLEKNRFFFGDCL